MNLNDLAIKTCLRPEISRSLQNYKQNNAKEMSENIFGQISDKTRNSKICPKLKVPK